MSQEEAVQFLNNGQILFIDDKKNPGYIGVLSDPAVIEKINQIAPDAEFGFSVLISESTRLYNYVRQVPDLAWDIIDYSEYPIEVSYPSGFNVPTSFLDPFQRVNVRVVKENEELYKLIKKLKKDLFFVPFSRHTKNATEEVLEMKPALRQIKKMKIELNGEVKFL